MVPAKLSIAISWGDYLQLNSILPNENELQMISEIHVFQLGHLYNRHASPYSEGNAFKHSPFLLSRCNHKYDDYRLYEWRFPRARYLAVCFFCTILFFFKVVLGYMCYYNPHVTEEETEPKEKLKDLLKAIRLQSSDSAGHGGSPL